MSLVALAAPRATRQPLATGPLQRKCACAETGESCARCAAAKGPIQRKAMGRLLPEGIPQAARVGLQDRGEPLAPGFAEAMGTRFGHDFSHVRIHSGPRAAQAAEAINAHAFTAGSHIVLSGRRSPQDGTLLAHELTHVVQQSNPAGEGADEAALEREADHLGGRALAGQPVSVKGWAPSVVQRQAAGPQGDTLRMVAVKIATTLGMSETAARLIVASIEGASAGFVEQWTTGGTGERVKAKLKEFSITDIPAMVGGYVVGLLQGVVSPITDLYSIAVLLEKVRDFGLKLVQSAISGAGGLKQELDGVLSALAGAAGSLGAAWRKLKEHPKDTLMMLLGAPGLTNDVMGTVEGVAQTMGHQAGTSIATSLESPFAEKKEEKKESYSPWTQTAQWVDQKLDEANEALMSGPWSKIGNKAGYALGWALVQALLLAFSGSIGNLVTWIGRSMGTLAEAGSLLGRTLEGVGAFVARAGPIIVEVEELIGKAVGLLLKPLMPVLEPVMKPLAEVMESVGRFFRKLFGIAEKDAAHLATTAATKTATAAHPPAPHAAQPAAPHPAAPVSEPKVPQGHAPGEQTKHLGTDSRDIERGRKNEPAGSGRAPESAELAPERPTEPMPTKPPETLQPAVEVAPEPLSVQKPGSEGHHVQVSERGVEVCSPPPCPLLNIEYAKELEASPRLEEAWNNIQDLRKTGKVSDMDKAAELAAVLQKNLASIRARSRILSNVKLSRAQQLRLEKTLDAAERFGATIDDQGANTLIGRLQGKSGVEIDAALEELDEVVTDVPASLGALKRRSGGEAVSPSNVSEPVAKRGVPNTAAPKTSAGAPPGFEEMASEIPSSVRTGPGGRQANPKTVLGTDVHTYFEDLPRWVRDDIERAFPLGQLPPGLEREVRVPDPRLPARGQPRIDRLDRKNGVIYEIGPAHSEAQKLAEAQGYAELMDRFDPLPPGRKWTPRVVTYDQATLRRFAREIGLIK
jgi:hypothetical protein